MNKILVFLSICLSINAFSQGEVADTSTVKRSFVPTGVRVGTDIYSLARGRFEKDFSAWEITVDTDVHRYLLVFDYGRSSSAFNADGADYKNEGHYWRAGIDANFLTRDADRNAFFLGLHFARATYDESMSIIAVDPVWGTNEETFFNAAQQARWLELNAGLKVKIWQWLWLGYTGRFKFGLKYDESVEMLSHQVPGYGKTNDETSWGFNYYIFIRIPTRKTTAILPPQKD